MIHPGEFILGSTLTVEKVTLEMYNISRLPIKLYAGMRIAQFALIKMSSPAARPYGSKGLNSKYKGQRGPSVSKIHEDFT